MCVCVFTHGQLSQRLGHAERGQEDVGGSVAARQDTEKVVTEVGGGSTHLCSRSREELQVFLLSGCLLAAGLRLQRTNDGKIS